MQNTSCKKIPVVIVSGFLGSGKTTFIQKLVAPSLNRERTVVLENEFGDVNFDGALLKKRGLSVVSVLAGCICCTGIGDFTGAIQEAAEQFSPQLLVIEPTGVAKLSEILVQFRLPPLSGLCEVKQAITVVDTKNFDKLHLISEEFYENQLVNSDVAVLSKTEGLDQETVREVTRRVHEIAPHILIVDRPWEQLSEEERETCQHYKKELGSRTRSHDHECGEHEHEHSCGHKGHDHEGGEHEHGHSCGHKGHDHECGEHEHGHSCGHKSHGHECGEHEHGHSCGHKGHDHECGEHEHEHSHAFVAYSYVPACDAQSFQKNAGALSGEHLGVVLRVKGFLHGADGALMQVDYVPGELRITKAADTAQDESPCLVFIGAGLKEQAIAQFLTN